MIILCLSTISKTQPKKQPDLGGTQDNGPGDDRGRRRGGSNLRNVGHGDDWGRRRDGSAPPFKKARRSFYGIGVLQRNWWVGNKPSMGRARAAQAANKIQGLYRIHSAKCSADRRRLARGLSFIAAREVAKMTKDPSTLKIGEYEMKQVRLFMADDIEGGMAKK